MIRDVLYMMFIIKNNNGKKRLNPFNPLNYVFIPCIIIVGVLLFGVIGVWRELDLRNPFKYH